MVHAPLDSVEFQQSRPAKPFISYQSNHNISLQSLAMPEPVPWHQRLGMNSLLRLRTECRACCGPFVPAVFRCCGSVLAHLHTCHLSVAPRAAILASAQYWARAQVPGTNRQPMQTGKIAG